VSFSDARRVCQTPSATVRAQNAIVATVGSAPGRKRLRLIARRLLAAVRALV
jgi:hypothetical protein